MSCTITDVRDAFLISAAEEGLQRSVDESMVPDVSFPVIEVPSVKSVPNDVFSRKAVVRIVITSRPARWIVRINKDKSNREKDQGSGGHALCLLASEQQSVPL